MIERIFSQVKVWSQSVETSLIKIFGKRVLIVLVGGYFVCGGFKPCSCGPFNSADLLFHEAGHVIFGGAGNYTVMWGGTLMRLLMPLAVAAHF